VGVHKRKMKIAFLCNVTPCDLVRRYKRLGGKSCRHLCFQGGSNGKLVPIYQITRHYFPGYVVLILTHMLTWYIINGRDWRREQDNFVRVSTWIRITYMCMSVAANGVALWMWDAIMLTLWSWTGIRVILWVSTGIRLTWWMWTAIRITLWTWTGIRITWVRTRVRITNECGLDLG
jgi:hypothetical protein